jgi:hypothetical protein
MTSTNGIDQVSALRKLVFGAIDGWNAEHPHPLSSHRERGSISVSVLVNDATGMPNYTIKVICGLAGADHQTFHGHDLDAVAEHARLTLERRIAAELRHRAENEHAAATIESRYGIAV